MNFLMMHIKWCSHWIIMKIGVTHQVGWWNSMNKFDINYGVLVALDADVFFMKRCSNGGSFDIA